ncbi:hypothetical protein E2C01_026653 [Portunus trituberculatus]|uniref:Uncharacterized protein n=1 Tax=Portunus trituberculatus TaxID=210409 RepID=A0A5B7EJH3_PORTR|nr:hypothetical protein [Portunus trituberculatus]
MPNQPVEEEKEEEEEEEEEEVPERDGGKEGEEEAAHEIGTSEARYENEDISLRTQQGKGRRKTGLRTWREGKTPQENRIKRNTD